MMLELTHVAKKYENPLGTGSRAVLNDISLQVAQGDCLGIVGPSGSGKSTLLNIMGSLDRPTSGSVFFDGRDLSVLEDAEIAEIRNREIGFVFQLHHLLPQCTVLENVLIPTIPLKDKQKRVNAEHRALALLERVGLDSHRFHFPAQLSGGELQRTAVVRALINRPKLVLADEPTGSLDQQSSRALAALLLELNREEGTALILVTHSLELAKKMDRLYTLVEGKLETVDLR